MLVKWKSKHWLMHEDHVHAVGWGRLSLVSGKRSEIGETINLLIKECARAPFEGIGKPEPLKGELSGHWSRRITQEHRLVYATTATELVIIACQYHYES
jgi:toxin YoeB